MSIKTGITGTTESLFTIGDSTYGVDGYKYIYADNGIGSLPGIRFNDDANQWEFANDGSTWLPFGSSTLPTGVEYQHLEHNGVDWEAVYNLTFRNTGQGSYNKIQLPTADADDSDHMQIIGGESFDGSSLFAGAVILTGGHGQGATPGGNIVIDGGASDSGTDGIVYIGHDQDGDGTTDQVQLGQDGSGNPLLLVDNNPDTNKDPNVEFRGRVNLHSSARVGSNITFAGDLSGDAEILVATQTTPLTFGGGMLLQGGTGNLAAGGNLTLLSGYGADGYDAGKAYLLGANGQTSGGAPGDVDVFAGTAVASGQAGGTLKIGSGGGVDAGNGGKFELFSGASTGSGNGGKFDAAGGSSVSGTGGEMKVIGGGSGSGTGGYAELAGGSGGTGTGGDVLIHGGSGVTADGNIALHANPSGWNTGEGIVYMHEAVTPPTGSVSTGGYLYGKNDGYIYWQTDEGEFNLVLGSGIPTSDHNNLVGLQGGNGSDEYYHLSNDDHTTLLTLSGEGAAGAIAVQLGGGLWTTLGPGTAGQVLKVAAGATTLEWGQDLPINTMHNNLAGLQGGDGAEDAYYHLDEFEHTFVVDGYNNGWTEAQGGTGETSYSTGDLLVGDAGGGLTKLAAPSDDGSTLVSNGIGPVLWAPNYYNAIYAGKQGSLLTSTDGYVLPNLTLASDETFPAFVTSIGTIVDNLYITVGTAPGAGETITVTVRDSSGDTAITAEITGAGSFTAVDQTNSVEFGSGAPLGFRVETTSGSLAEDLTVTLMCRPKYVVA